MNNEITFEQFNKDFDYYIDHVTETGTVVTVVLDNGSKVAVVPAGKYNSLIKEMDDVHHLRDHDDAS
jgi:PHD/YefM family antitoxin component YafN of YafNO toxin-antitoxin module